LEELDSVFELSLRFGFFLIILVLLTILEIVRPLRKLQHPKTNRWFANFSVSLTNTIIVSLIFPVIGVTGALFAMDRGWGLFNIINLSPIITIPIYLLLFDLTIYLQHRLFHSVGALWKLHRMHHSDMDYDLSTGIRFHPLSIIVSNFIKLGLIFLLGPVAIAVLISEIVLNGTSMFNHSNWDLPKGMDSNLRRFLVTPNMHRIHHSIKTSEANCNFGFNFPWWDKLFGTYKAQPDLGHRGMEVGIHHCRDERAIKYFSLIREPFREDDRELK